MSDRERAPRPSLLPVPTGRGPAWALTNWVRFDADEIPGSTRGWAAANPHGRPVAQGSALTATLYYTNLPPSNGAFGVKRARLRLHGQVREEKCFWAFYPADAYNYPGCTGPPYDPDNPRPGMHRTPPNYFFYYMQTPAAVRSPCCNSPTFHYGGSATQFGLVGNPPPTPLFPYCVEIRRERHGRRIFCPGANAGHSLSYIDLFAWAVRHERSHHDAYHAWWTTGSPPRVWSREADGDEDFLPDDLEPYIPAAAGGPYDPTKRDTYGDDPHWDDDERHAAMTAEVWTIRQQERSFRYDWAKPGKNWPGAE